MRSVNLLPEQHRPRRAAGAKSGSAYAVLGILGALLVALVVYVLAANQVTSRETQAAEAKRDAEAAEARTGRLGGFADFAAVKSTRETSIRGLAQARFDWERLMRELALVLPDGSWLTAVDAGAAANEGESSDASSAGSQDSSATPAGSGLSATLAGCARHQNDVATLIVRLRELHRVQDVTLGESVKEDEEEGGSSPSSGGGADGCAGRFKFDLTVAFGVGHRSEAPARVPAALGGGS